MLQEPTTLGYGIELVAAALESDFDIDPAPIFTELGINRADLLNPETRIANSKFQRMWEIASNLCPDPGLGVAAGMHTDVRHIGVLGYAWMSSANLAEAFERLLRFEMIVDAGITDLAFVKEGDEYCFSEAYPNPADYHGKLGTDEWFSAIIMLCRAATNSEMRATRGEFLVAKDDPLDIYEPLVDGPVSRHPTRNAWYFSAADIERPMPGAQADVASATSRIAERYIESLDGTAVASKVRETLIRLLPGGEASQEQVAAALFRSASTLQRQLKSEGTTYREVVDATLREIAESYLRDGRYTIAQIAFLTGFGDQSNFSRAFKRWTGLSPGDFRKQHSA